jgi:formimidoylglutamate deiminase
MYRHNRHSRKSGNQQWPEISTGKESGMAGIHAAHALTPEGWRTNVRLTLADGVFAAIEAGAAAEPGDEACAIALPGMPNVHSHAFQRAMAGLAEIRGQQADDFWTWREAMYRFALTMNPDQAQAVAAQLYVEMLEAGFTRVGEFHYLHHDKDGSPYAAPAEMAQRIAAAAEEVGIGLTLLPVFYAHSDFGALPPTPGQRRFVTSLDAYGRLLDDCRAIASRIPGANAGVAPHSLRAVAPHELDALIGMARGGPIHMHIAEQTREVEACLAATGARPVDWLFDHAAPDQRWCLIHATHMTEGETTRLARSGAVAGLCPITEANLGDGIFNAPEFIAAGGAFGIGSDSNIEIGVARELRQLEYAQRLRLRARNVLARAGGSTGEALLQGAVAGGGRALDAPAGIAPGRSADLVTLDMDHPALAGRAPGQCLDALIFAGATAIDGVWVRGRKLVAGGRHRDRAPIARRFAQAMAELLG